MRRPAKQKGYCNYCWQHISVSDNTKQLFKHKPRNHDTTKVDYCPGPSHQMGWAKQKPTTGVSPFKRELNDGTWKDDGTGMKVYQPGTSSQSSPEPAKGSDPVIASYAEQLRLKAATMLPDNPDKDVWDRGEVMTLLTAFLTLEPEAANQAAEMVGVVMSEEVDGQPVRTWNTPDGQRLYTQQEMLSVKTELLGATDAARDLNEERLQLEHQAAAALADAEALRERVRELSAGDVNTASAAFQLAVQTEVDKQLAELTDDDLAMRCAELARQLDEAEQTIEHLSAQQQQRRSVPVSSPTVISYDPEEAKLVKDVAAEEIAGVDAVALTNGDIVELVIDAYKRGLNSKVQIS